MVILQTSLAVLVTYRWSSMRKPFYSSKDWIMKRVWKQDQSLRFDVTQNAQSHWVNMIKCPVTPNTKVNDFPYINERMKVQHWRIQFLPFSCSYWETFGQIKRLAPPSPSPIFGVYALPVWEIIMDPPLFNKRRYETHDWQLAFMLLRKSSISSLATASLPILKNARCACM